MTYRVSAYREGVSHVSYLALFKEADARLRATHPGNAVNALNAESTHSEGDYRVNRVNRVPESSRTPVDPAEVSRVLGLPLDQLDRVLEVRVPWLPVTLWFCPGRGRGPGAPS